MLLVIGLISVVKHWPWSMLSSLFHFVVFVRLLLFRHLTYFMNSLAFWMNTRLSWKPDYCAACNFSDSCMLFLWKFTKWYSHLYVEFFEITKNKQERSPHENYHPAVLTCWSMFHYKGSKLQTLARFSTSLHQSLWFDGRKLSSCLQNNHQHMCSWRAGKCQCREGLKR